MPVAVDISNSDHGPTHHPAGSKKSCAEERIAERAAHVPSEYLSRHIVLPYQVWLPITVDVDDGDECPTRHPGGGEVGCTEKSVTKRAAHVPRVQLARYIVLPDEVRHSVRIEIPRKPDGSNGYRKHIRRPRVCCSLIGYAVDPQCGAVFQVCPYYHRVPARRHRPAKVVTRLCGPHRGRFQVRLLTPHTCTPGEHIRRTGAARQPIWRAIDSGRGTGFPDRPHHHCVPAHRHRPAKVVKRLAGPHRGRFHVRLLAPYARTPGEHIRRPGVACPLIGRAVDPRRRTGFPVRPHHYRVPAYRYRNAKEVTCLRGPHCGRFQVRLLAPHTRGPGEHICRAGAAGELIRRAVDPRRGTGFPVRPHHHRVPVHRHGIAKLVTYLCGPDRGRFQVRLLAPDPRSPDKDISRPGVLGSLTGRAVDPHGGAVFPDRPHHHRVLTHCHRPAKPVIYLRGPHRGRFQVRLLAPHTRTS